MKFALFTHVSWPEGTEPAQIFRPVQVICIFHKALVRWVLQFFASLRIWWKERAHAQL